jgi:hypothetical protein
MQDRGLSAEASGYGGGPNASSAPARASSTHVTPSSCPERDRSHDRCARRSIPTVRLVRTRLNVAISRARCMAYLVGSPRLLDVRCRSVEQMRLVNALCRFVEQAE